MHQTPLVPGDSAGRQASDEGKFEGEGSFLERETCLQKEGQGRQKK
jgi:hypothetical protein